jgi:hypothetical protein
MNIYIAKWPDGTISILSANNKDDLILRLDSEASPSYAKLYKVPMTEGNLHITTHLKNVNGEKEIQFSSGEYGERPKKIRNQLK